ncbi:MAG: hypothetical protein RTU63_00960 [Candidatus Thorarchaeota archaeon]
MSKAVKTNWENRIIVSLFALFSLSFLISGISGSAWQILLLTDFNFYLVIICITLAVTAGALLTYSFISFFQNREIKHLMLLVMSANIILWIILFLLSHPSSADWSIYFSDRNRNRTLAMAFVLIVIPTILLGSFTGEMKPSRPSVFLLILWGEVVIPIFSLVLFFSLNPLFEMVTSEGGIQGLTPIGTIISMGYLISQIIALPWLIKKWRKTRNTTDLSLMLAVALWIIGTLFIIILWDPLQVAELLWVSSIIAGFLLIAISQFMSAIIHPHRFLEQQVQQRTRELNQSIRESDLLRKMWTHKMGNLLQGLITYLDILEHAAQHSEEDSDTRAAARNLSREATLVNLQVSQLTKIKEHVHDALYPVNVVPLLEEAIGSAEQIIGENNFSVEFNRPEGYSIIADGFLPLVFQSLFSFHAKKRIDDTIKFSITLNSEKHQQIIQMVSKGKDIPADLREFMESEQDMESIALDLNLFTAKLLLTRYNATIQCERNETTSENSCRLIFPSSK